MQCLGIETQQLVLLAALTSARHSEHYKIGASREIRTPLSMAWKASDVTRTLRRICLVLSIGIEPMYLPCKDSANPLS